MRAKELRERNDEELEKMVDESGESMFKFRLQNATHQLDDTSQMRKTRREIARIKTILNERKAAAKDGNPASESEE